MKTLFILLSISSIILSGASKSDAGTKYSLLIGINNYIKPDTSKHIQLARPSGIHDLPASENDVSMMKQILTARFGFQQSNITTLLNEHATHDSILAVLNRKLIACQRGDIFFFYFAGHGSQMKNPLSDETDKMDETIVPADGIYFKTDIRDKDLAKIFQQFLDKGVIVTAVFESCHSGSIARGIGFVEEMIAPSQEVIEDGKHYPEPEKNGALIISAAQDFQSAMCVDLSDGSSYSFFTKAFVDAVKVHSSNVAAQDLVNATLVQLKNSGCSQIPTLAGNNSRRRAPLLGEKTGDDSALHLSVENILADKTIVLQGGTAAGLERGTQLKNENNSITIEVTGNPDLTKANAKVIVGNSALVKSSSIFHVTRYAYSSQNKLQFAMPAISMSRAEFFHFKNQLEDFIVQKNLHLISDPISPADYWLYFNEGKWFLAHAKSENDLGSKLNFDSLPAMIENGKTIRLQLPAYSSMSTHIKALLTDQYSCVNISSLANSDYFLSGTLSNNQLNYELVKTQVDSSSLSVFPPKGDPVLIDTTQEQKSVNEVCDYLWKLSRIKSWLNLSNANEGESFPYDISLKNTSTGKMIGGGTVHEGEEYQLYLVKNNSIPPSQIKKRWVYIFVLSSDGGINLLFPQAEHGSVENFLPVDSTHDEEKINAMPDSVVAPFGIDNIICLTSAEPLQNLTMIEQEGITSRGVGQNPLDELVMNMNARTRSATTVKAPQEWSIQKIRFHSVPK